MGNGERAFHLTDDEMRRAKEWMKEKRTENQGAIGGQFSFSFTPTTLGCVTKVIDSVSKEELDLTDYDMW